MPVVMSSAATPVEIIPGHPESHSGVERKPFAFPPESLFAFSQESCSSSPRNRFHVRPGIPFALPRNPQFAMALDVSTDDLLLTPKTKKNTKPTRKVLRRLELIESLPSHQQQTVLKTIDTMLKGLKSAS